MLQVHLSITVIAKFTWKEKSECTLVQCIQNRFKINLTRICTGTGYTTAHTQILSLSLHGERLSDFTKNGNEVNSVTIVYSAHT